MKAFDKLRDFSTSVIGIRRWTRKYLVLVHT